MGEGLFPLLSIKGYVMDYLYVGGASDNSGIRKLILNAVSTQTNGVLFSLVDGMNKKDFGCVSMSSVARNINTCLNPFDEGFVDSGGYSIINGDIHPRHIIPIIDCWEYYIEHEREIYSFGMGLDIPVSLKYDELNTRNKIYKYNKLSLITFINIIQKFPDIGNKLFFVEQFKMLPQYEIWKQLYHELNLGKYIQNRAIGGMVGIRKVTHIKFSPFTAIAFKCLLDFITSEKDCRVFRLHFLGISNVYDRLHIAVLEKLFAYYLDCLGYSITVKFSYDSVNFAYTARKKKSLPVYTSEGTNLIYNDTALAVPEDVLFTVYNEAGLYQHILSEIDLRRRGYDISNISSLVPLNIHSNMNIDRYFERLVDEYDLVGLIVKNRSMTVVTSNLQSILMDLNGKLPQLFTKHIQGAIENNIGITHKFHTWFIDNRSYEKLDEHIKLFIMRIGFPNCIR